MRPAADPVPLGASTGAAEPLSPCSVSRLHFPGAAPGHGDLGVPPAGGLRGRLAAMRALQAVRALRGVDADAAVAVVGAVNGAEGGASYLIYPTDHGRWVTLPRSHSRDPSPRRFCGVLNAGATLASCDGGRPSFTHSACGLWMKLCST